MVQEQAYVESILEQLDTMMLSDDDEALFISGYLRGHVTYLVGQLEMKDELTEEKLITAVNKALVTARQSGELSSQDAEFVEQAWRSLISAL